MIDAWSGPIPTPQQFPANEPNGIRKLLDKIRAVELQVKESTSNLLRTAGIRLTKLGMFIDSSLTVGGSETVNGPLAVHGTASFDGATTIGGTLGVSAPTTLGAATTVSGSLGVSGPMTVSGTLSLPAGIIGNDALTSPVAPGLVWKSATNFALSTTFATLLTSTITVPPGFTQCAVSMSSRVYAINPNTTGGVDSTGGDWLYTRTNIAGYYPAALPTLVGGTRRFAIAISPLSQLLTGLTPGSTFNITAEAKVTYLAWAADVNNTADLSGSLQWFR